MNKKNTAVGVLLVVVSCGTITMDLICQTFQEGYMKGFGMC
jgi:hypothetical protein